MNDAHGHGCAEFEQAGRMSRRTLLQGMAAGTGVMVAGQLFGGAMLEATFGAGGGGNVLVVLSFRGGIDGLGVVVPHGDPAYYAARPTLRAIRTREGWAGSSGQDRYTKLYYTGTFRLYSLVTQPISL